jgi:carboxymethylenebutenolidase
MPWLLPGIAPTGKPLAIAFVVVIGFAGDRIATERIVFDQAAVLAQFGLLDATRLPIVTTEAADLFAGAPVQANGLMGRAS